MALLPMTATKRLARFCSGILIGTVLTTTAIAQDSPSPSPTPQPARKSVRISFLPPPLEGAISLGIYDAKGKLVRVLHREADIDDFEIGNDALSTTWDGKSDAGESLPAGQYHARGFVVGELLVEGVDFFFNDWVTDEQSPHITKITAVGAENGVPILAVELPGGETGSVVCDAMGNVITTGEARAFPSECEPTASPETVDAIACAAGKDGTLWIVDRLQPGSAETEVHQFSAAKELLRRLSVPAEEPQPRAIAASKDADTIFVVEENSAMQR